MRAIKFRAWNKEAKVMVDLYKITPLAMNSDLKQDGLFIPFDERFELLQFTGLTIEDGTEVYEGDIIDFTVFDYNGHDTQHKGSVVFAEGMFQIWKTPESEYFGNDGAFDLHWVANQDDTMRVIGNTYENPELMGGTR